MSFLLISREESNSDIKTKYKTRGNAPRVFSCDNGDGSLRVPTGTVLFVTVPVVTQKTAPHDTENVSKRTVPVVPLFISAEYLGVSEKERCDALCLVLYDGL